jgi:hypothetical protein
MAPRVIASFAFLLASASTAVAQPSTTGTAPTSPAAPAPDPAAPATTPPESVPPDTSAAPEAPTQPVTEPDPVAVEAPPEEKKADEPPALHVSYDKGIRFHTDDEEFEAKLALRTQLRFESFRSLEDGAESQSRFYLPRVRLQLDGNVFGKDNRYKLELGVGDRGSFSFVKDYIVEKKVSGVWFRIGQWKRPFSRQEMTSDFSGTFNERSIANDFAGGGRDLGFAIHNDYEKSPEGLEWVVGIFNGFSGGSDRPRITTTCEQDPVTLEITCTNGAAQSFPTDFSPTAIVRVGYNQGKIKGYSEVDFEGGPLRFSVAANYKVDLADLGKGAEESVGDNLSHGIGVDAIVKVNGFDATVGGYGMKLKTADLGFAGFAQAGLLVIPKKAHVAGRFAFAEIPGTDDYLLEVRGAFSYFFASHALKIASDVGFLKATGGGDPEIQVRIMPQLTF